jgi:negative regulator of sigma E activity
MNDESLSALLDGACAPAELDRVLGELKQDPALRRRLSRLALARETVRGVRTRAANLDFADRVMAGLDTAPVDGSVQALRPAKPSWQPLVGLALAAGVVGVAVLALKPQPGTAPAPVPVPVAAVDSRPVAAVPNQDFASLDAQKRQQLRNYLIAYSQSRAQQGMGGTLGYARYAAYTDTQDPGH